MQTAEQTHFAPARRTSPEHLERQIEEISQSPLISTFLTTMSGVLLILNEERQIVGLNNSFLHALGIHDPEAALGLRLGESLDCIHAREMVGGCGTSLSCRSCGAVIAMVSSLESGEPAEEMCVLDAVRDGVATNMSLLVNTAMLALQGERYLVVGIKDVTREQMRANMERVFYHDLGNIMSTLLIPSEMLYDELPHRWEVAQIYEAAHRLSKEIAMQRELSQEAGKGFVIESEPVRLSEIEQDLQGLLKNHRAKYRRELFLLRNCGDYQVRTDRVLVGRVLVNMLINAFEATDEGGTVRLITSMNGSDVTWEVWNTGYIPESVQPRIFQRHFSTKANIGRGLGTYSMKLFGEKYLRGTVGFVSNRDQGTTFSFTLPRKA